jgi:hypothetical protein
VLHLEPKEAYGGSYYEIETCVENPETTSHAGLRERQRTEVEREIRARSTPFESRTTSAMYSSGGKTAPETNRHQLMCRRLPAFFDRPPTTASNFFSYSSTFRGYPTKLPFVFSGGLSSSTAHFRILIAALKSRFTNSIRSFPPLVVLTYARSPRTFALLSICSSVSGPYLAISSGIRRHFFISTR